MKQITHLYGLFTVVLALVALYSFMPQSVAQGFLTNGLVAYYPFNGNANDVVGNNNGTVYGAVLSTNHLGQPNSAYLFNGTSSYIDCGAPPNLAFRSNFTVSAWCLFNGNSEQNPKFVSYTWGQGYELMTQYTGPSRGFGFVLGDGYVFTARIYTQNVWYGVAAVVSNTTAYIYVNGVAAGSGSVGTPTYTNNMHIGNNSGTTQWDWWGGLISNVRFYNRALSTNEVAQLYAIEASPQVLTLGKAVYPEAYSLTIGSNYQVQVSSDLLNWTNYGAPFTVTSPYWRCTNYWDVVNWNQLFFRLQNAP